MQLSEVRLSDNIPASRRIAGFDVYELDDRLLLVADDSISVAGQRLPDLIPNKGLAVAHMAAYWFELLDGVIGTSLISTNVASYPEQFQPFASELQGRSLLLANVEELPVDARVVGYLTRDVLDEYQSRQTVGGVEFPPGLTEAERLEQCIYIPYLLDSAGEVAGGGPDGDLPDQLLSQPPTQIDLMQSIDIFGPRTALVMSGDSIDIYQIIHDLALARGFIIADLHLRFGLSGDLLVLTEVPTPDSALFWLPADYQVGQQPANYLTQMVEDWLAANWDGNQPLPPLPDEVIAVTAERYIQVVQMISGEDLAWGNG